MLQEYYQAIYQNDFEFIANFLALHHGYTNDTPYDLLLRAHLYDKVEEVFVSEVVEDSEKGEYILLRSSKWIDSYSQDYVNFIEEVIGSSKIKGEDHIPFTEYPHVIPLLEIALTLMDLSCDDIYYSLAKSYLYDRFSQEYPKPEDINLTPDLEFYHIMYDAFEYLNYLKKPMEAVDTLQMIMSKLPREKKNTDSSNP